MKKMMITLAAIMMAGSMNAKNEKVAPFEGVKFNVPARVRIVYGDEYSVDIQAADSLVASAVRWNVKNGVLNISSIDPNEDLGDLCITIVTAGDPTIKVGHNLEFREDARKYEDVSAL